MKYLGVCYIPALTDVAKYCSATMETLGPSKTPVFTGRHDVKSQNTSISYPKIKLDYWQEFIRDLIKNAT